MIFVIVAVLALICFALLSAVDVRNRSLRRRGWRSTSRCRARKSRGCAARGLAMLADTAQRTVGGQRWWQRFETDVELAGFSLSAARDRRLDDRVGGIFASIAGAIIFKALVGLLIGLAAPSRDAMVRRHGGSRRCGERSRSSSPTTSTCWPVAMRTGHSTMGALSVMVDSAIEPSKTEFRRVLAGRAAGRPARRRAHGDGPPDAEPRR